MQSSLTSLWPNGSLHVGFKALTGKGTANAVIDQGRSADSELARSNHSLPINSTGQSAAGQGERQQPLFVSVYSCVGSTEACAKVLDKRHMRSALWT